jgi:hypothetical protein
VVKAGNFLFSLGNNMTRKRCKCQTNFKFLLKIEIDSAQVHIKQGATVNNQLEVDETGERFGNKGAWQVGFFIIITRMAVYLLRRFYKKG